MILRGRQPLSKFTLAALASSVLAASAAAQERSYRFDIANEPLSQALRSYSQIAEQEIIFTEDVVAGAEATTLKGEFTPEQALQKLLEGTGLVAERSPSGAIMIRRPRLHTSDADVRATSGVSQQNAAMIRVAQRNDTDRTADADSTSRAAPAEDERETGSAERRTSLEEILVTGSHIRGAQNLSSPMITFSREDIEASGYATTQQLIQSLPQNLSNLSDTTFGSANGGPGGVDYRGSGINLRGLGSESTLVLLNGRRLSAAGRGNFVDVSLIPLSAIERVEVLTDGASAIYGSDAVGGVVNFVLRKDFEGAETRVRYGSVTEGDHDEVQAGQLFGETWRSGQALISYEYYRRSPLDGKDRDFIQPNETLSLYDAIPGLTRHGALAMISQRLSDSVEVSTELFFGQRDSRYNYDTGIPFIVDSEVQQYGGSFALKMDLPRGWQTRISGLIDQSDSDEKTYLQDGTLFSPAANSANESRVWSVDLAADGSVGHVPGGEMHLALGGQFRNEDFVEGYIGYPARLKRDIAAAYAELRVPWVSVRNRRAGLENLELTIAGRFEDYSDFGTTFNPKIGWSWAPLQGVNVRGTWGTSFKAPLFSQMNPRESTANVYESMFRDPSGGTTPAVLLIGSGVELQPEESTNWTLGLDLRPAALPELDVTLSYFDIEYEERIRVPFPSGYDVFGVLMDPTYASLVARNPDPDELVGLLNQFSSVACLSSDGAFVAPCVEPPVDQITAVVDRRLTNLAEVQMSGLDFSVRYQLQNAFGTWALGLSGQYLVENRERLLPGAPVTDALNDVWRPVDLRLRNSLSFARGPLSTVVFVNYTGGYDDGRAALFAGPLQRSSVASWTTVDLTVQCDLSAHLKRLGFAKATLGLTAINVLDKDPPFVASIYGLHFDGVNANPLGRFVSAQITARW